jgi:hypothetical protein
MKLVQYPFNTPKFPVSIIFPSAWRFGTFGLWLNYDFPFSWNFYHPNWLIFFRGVGQPPTSHLWHLARSIQERQLCRRSSRWKRSRLYGVVSSGRLGQRRVAHWGPAHLWDLKHFEPSNPTVTMVISVISSYILETLVKQKHLYGIPPIITD